MKRSNDDEHFEVNLPVEHRWEHRLPYGHAYSEWKFKQIEFNHRCAYCGIHRKNTPEGYLTRDHVVAIQNGGSDDITNIVPACKRCNFLKSTYPAGTGMVPVPRPRRRYRRWPWKK